MKLLSMILLISFLPSNVLGAEGAPSFSKVEDAVAFISQCVQTNDSERLFNSCLAPGEKSSFIHIVERLKALNEETILSKLYAHKSFPWFGSRFKLGGHGFEWGHIHIDFVRKDGAWYLNNIWQCR